MSKRTSVRMGIAIVAVAFLTACSSPATPEGEPAEGSEGPYTIGVSNAFVGSEYRTQMIEAIDTVFADYESQGVVDRLILENADTDVSGQIQQIRNLINQDVDAIIVDPNSATALGAVFDEAIGQGIKVYAIDQAVESEGVLNVGISQEDLGEANATWFAEQVGDGARIVTVEGAAGNPATDARWAGAEKIFTEHDIEVLAHGDGGWDQATGQTVATDLLAAYPDVDGIWTYDGMAQGVLRAVQAADKVDSIVVSGEARVGFMRMWNDLRDTDFASVGIVNPPGTGATALHVAINQLQGRELDPARVTDGHNIVLDLAPAVTNDTFDEEWAKVSDRPDTYVIDSVLSAEEVSGYFLQP